MNLEQIARKAAEEWGLCFDEDGLVRIPQGFHLITFVKEVVAELTKGQEPVARIEGTGGVANMPLLRWISADHSFRAPIGSMLYSAPPICPTCTQMIDEAARQGRIVDDRIKHVCCLQGFGALDDMCPACNSAAAPEYKP